MIQGVKLTPLKIFTGDLGDVLHGIRNQESSFHGFGEAYFSTVKQGKIKGWKRHSKMTLNLIVPCGEIKFVLYDNRTETSTSGQIFEIKLSRNNYQRLTLPPMIWMAFQGIGEGLNMLLNIASIPHDPQESESLDLNENRIHYIWE